VDVLESFSSIQARIQAYQQNQKNKENAQDAIDKYANQPSQLLPFDTHPPAEQSQITLPMHFTDYLTLVAWTGQAIRDDKKGAIPAHITPILQRLAIDEKEWLMSVVAYKITIIKFPKLLIITFGRNHMKLPHCGHNKIGLCQIII